MSWKFGMSSRRDHDRFQFLTYLRSIRLLQRAPTEMTQVRKCLLPVTKEHHSFDYSSQYSVLKRLFRLEVNRAYLDALCFHNFCIALRPMPIYRCVGCVHAVSINRAIEPTRPTMPTIRRILCHAFRPSPSGRHMALPENTDFSKGPRDTPCARGPSREEPQVARGQSGAPHPSR